MPHKRPLMVMLEVETLDELRAAVHQLAEIPGMSLTRYVNAGEKFHPPPARLKHGPRS